MFEKKVHTVKVFAGVYIYILIKSHSQFIPNL